MDFFLFPNLFSRSLTSALWDNFLSKLPEYRLFFKIPHSRELRLSHKAPQTQYV